METYRKRARNISVFLFFLNFFFLFSLWLYLFLCSCFNFQVVIRFRLQGLTAAVCSVFCQMLPCWWLLPVFSETLITTVVTSRRHSLHMIVFIYSILNVVSCSRRFTSVELDQPTVIWLRRVMQATYTAPGYAAVCFAGCTLRRSSVSERGVTETRKF
jgi:hypothetical protein